MKQILHRILSFDGGGIRGLYQAHLLDRLLAYGLDVASSADVLAGTSTGAIVAGALAVGMKPHEIAALYTSLGAKVFPPLSRTYRRTKLLYRGSDYSSDVLRAALEESRLGKRMLGDCQKRLIVAAVSLSQYKLHVFDSEDRNANTLPLVDVVLASTAAPTYFLPAKVGNVYYVDGGLCCNNPAFQAVGKLCHANQGEDRDIDLAQIYVLSISTGGLPVTHDGATYAGLRQYEWARATIDLAMSGSSDIAIRDCALTGYHYRIEEHLGTQIALDDNKSAQGLLPAIAQEKADNVDVRSSVRRWIDGPPQTGQSFAGKWKGFYTWQSGNHSGTTQETIEVEQCGDLVHGEASGEWPYVLWGRVRGNVLIGEWKGRHLRGSFLLVKSLVNGQVDGHWAGTSDDNKPFFGPWSWQP